MFDGGHLSFHKGPKINSVRPIGGMASKIKFEVDWLSGSKDISFTRGVYSIHIKKFKGGHLSFCTWPKINSVRPIGVMTSKIKFEVDWLSGSKDIAFTRGVYSIHIKKYDGFRTWPKINSVCVLVV